MNIGLLTLVYEPSPFEVKFAMGNLKIYKSPGSDQIVAELIQARSNTLCCGSHKLTNSTWNKKELTQQWNESIIVPIYRKGDSTEWSKYRCISVLKFKSLCRQNYQGSLVQVSM
jgi:hypothetical protein